MKNFTSSRDSSRRDRWTADLDNATGWRSDAALKKGIERRGGQTATGGLDQQCILGLEHHTSEGIDGHLGPAHSRRRLKSFQTWGEVASDGIVGDQNCLFRWMQRVQRWNAGGLELCGGIGWEAVIPSQPLKRRCSQSRRGHTQFATLNIACAGSSWRLKGDRLLKKGKQVANC